MRSWAYNGFGVLMGTSWQASGPRWPSLRTDSLPMITLFHSQGDFCATAPAALFDVRGIKALLGHSRDTLWALRSRQYLPSPGGETRMATIEQRTTRDGQTVYRVKVRRKGAPLQTATFSKRSEARKWEQMTEGAVLEGWYLKTAEAKRHTLADLIDRYIRDVLPRKRPSTA